MVPWLAQFTRRLGLFPYSCWMDFPAHAFWLFSQPPHIPGALALFPSNPYTVPQDQMFPEEPACPPVP